MSFTNGYKLLFFHNIRQDYLSVSLFFSNQRLQNINSRNINWNINIKTRNVRRDKWQGLFRKGRLASMLRRDVSVALLVKTHGGQKTSLRLMGWTGGELLNNHAIHHWLGRASLKQILMAGEDCRQKWNIVNNAKERIKEEGKGFSVGIPQGLALRAVCFWSLCAFSFLSLFPQCCQVFYFFFPKKLNLFSRSFSLPSLLRRVTLPVSPVLGEMGGIVIARLSARGAPGESWDRVVMKRRMDWIQEFISALKQNFRFWHFVFVCFFAWMLWLPTILTAHLTSSLAWNRYSFPFSFLRGKRKDLAFTLETLSFFGC